MADAVKVMRGLEELFPENRFLERLRHCVETFPEQNWDDAMSRGQIRSKQWLIHELTLLGLTHLGRVVVCGGWLGILPRMLLDSKNITTGRIDSLDWDVEASVASRDLNHEYSIAHQFLSRGVDAHHHDYTYYDTVINTSTEHFEDFYHWWSRIPEGKLVILQNTNFTEPDDHHWTMEDEEDFENNVGPLENLIFRGTLTTYKYKRFMLIGVK